LIASAELISGFGAPALLDQVAQRVADQNQDVGGLAALQAHRDRIDRRAHRGAVSRDHLVARRLLELRHQRIIGRGKPARDHHMHLGCVGRARQPKDCGNAKRQVTKMDGWETH
jgi:hypothetical protein